MTEAAAAAERKAAPPGGEAAAKGGGVTATVAAATITSLTLGRANVRATATAVPLPSTDPSRWTMRSTTTTTTTSTAAGGSICTRSIRISSRGNSSSRHSTSRCSNNSSASSHSISLGSSSLPETMEKCHGHKRRGAKTATVVSRQVCMRSTVISPVPLISGTAASSGCCCFKTKCGTTMSRGHGTCSSTAAASAAAATRCSRAAATSLNTDNADEGSRTPSTTCSEYAEDGRRLSGEWEGPSVDAADVKRRILNRCCCFAYIRRGDIDRCATRSNYGTRVGLRVSCRCCCRVGYARDSVTALRQHRALVARDSQKQLHRKQQDQHDSRHVSVRRDSKTSSTEGSALRLQTPAVGAAGGGMTSSSMRHQRRRARRQEEQEENSNNIRNDAQERRDLLRHNSGGGRKSLSGLREDKRCVPRANSESLCVEKATEAAATADGLHGQQRKWLTDRGPSDGSQASEKSATKEEYVKQGDRKSSCSCCGNTMSSSSSAFTQRNSDTLAAHTTSGSTGSALRSRRRSSGDRDNSSGHGCLRRCLRLQQQQHHCGKAQCGTTAPVKDPQGKEAAGAAAARQEQGRATPAASCDEEAGSWATRGPLLCAHCGVGEGGSSITISSSSSSKGSDIKKALPSRVHRGQEQGGGVRSSDRKCVSSTNNSSGICRGVNEDNFKMMNDSRARRRPNSSEGITTCCTCSAYQKCSIVCKSNNDGKDWPTVVVKQQLNKSQPEDQELKKLHVLVKEASEGRGFLKNDEDCSCICKKYQRQWREGTSSTALLTKPGDTSAIGAASSDDCSAADVLGRILEEKDPQQQQQPQRRSPRLLCHTTVEKRTETSVPMRERLQTALSPAEIVRKSPAVIGGVVLSPGMTSPIADDMIVGSPSEALYSHKSERRSSFFSSFSIEKQLPPLKKKYRRLQTKQKSTLVLQQGRGSSVQEEERAVAAGRRSSGKSIVAAESVTPGGTVPASLRASGGGRIAGGDDGGVAALDRIRKAAAKETRAVAAAEETHQALVASCAAHGGRRKKVRKVPVLARRGKKEKGGSTEEKEQQQFSHSFEQQCGPLHLLHSKQHRQKDPCSKLQQSEIRLGGDTVAVPASFFTLLKQLRQRPQQRAVRGSGAVAAALKRRQMAERRRHLRTCTTVAVISSQTLGLSPEQQQQQHEQPQQKQQPENRVHHHQHEQKEQSSCCVGGERTAGAAGGSYNKASDSSNNSLTSVSGPGLQSSHRICGETQSNSLHAVNIRSNVQRGVRDVAAAVNHSSSSSINAEAFLIDSTGAVGGGTFSEDDVAAPTNRRAAVHGGTAETEADNSSAHGSVVATESTTKKQIGCVWGDSSSGTAQHTHGNASQQPGRGRLLPSFYSLCPRRLSKLADQHQQIQRQQQTHMMEQPQLHNTQRKHRSTMQLLQPLQIQTQRSNPEQTAHQVEGANLPQQQMQSEHQQHEEETQRHLDCDKQAEESSPPVCSRTRQKDVRYAGKEKEEEEKESVTALPWGQQVCGDNDCGDEERRRERKRQRDVISADAQKAQDRLLLSKEVHEHRRGCSFVVVKANRSLEECQSSYKRRKSHGACSRQERHMGDLMRGYDIDRKNVNTSAHVTSSTTSIAAKDCCSGVALDTGLSEASTASVFSAAVAAGSGAFVEDSDKADRAEHAAGAADSLAKMILEKPSVLVTRHKGDVKRKKTAAPCLLDGVYWTSASSRPRRQERDNNTYGGCDLSGSTGDITKSHCSNNHPMHNSNMGAGVSNGKDDNATGGSYTRRSFEGGHVNTRGTSTQNSESLDKERKEPGAVQNGAVAPSSVFEENHHICAMRRGERQASAPQPEAATAAAIHTVNAGEAEAPAVEATAARRPLSGAAACHTTERRHPASGEGADSKLPAGSTACADVETTNGIAAESCIAATAARSAEDRATAADVTAAATGASTVVAVHGGLVSTGEKVLSKTMQCGSSEKQHLGGGKQQKRQRGRSVRNKSRQRWRRGYGNLLRSAMLPVPHAPAAAHIATAHRAPSLQLQHLPPQQGCEGMVGTDVGQTQIQTQMLSEGTDGVQQPLRSSEEKQQPQCVQQSVIEHSEGGEQMVLVQRQQDGKVRPEQHQLRNEESAYCVGYIRGLARRGGWERVPPSLLLLLLPSELTSKGSTGKHNDWSNRSNTRRNRRGITTLLPHGQDTVTAAAGGGSASVTAEGRDAAALSDEAAQEKKSKYRKLFGRRGEVARLLLVQNEWEKASAVSRWRKAREAGRAETLGSFRSRVRGEPYAVGAAYALSVAAR